MAFEQFNSVGGYSIGIPPVPVIDSNGYFVSNVLTAGNVVANVIRGTTFLYANGQPYSPPAGGNNGQLQFNSAGSFAGVPNVTWNGNVLNLGNISALSIGGGLNGYFLQTDGTGNLSWAAGGGGGGNGNPGGANTQIQFNDAGTFGGDAGFTYNKNTNTVDLVNINATGDVNLGSVANLTITGGANGYVLKTDGLGNLSWAAGGGGGNGTPGGSNTQVQFNDDGTFAGDATFTFDKDSGILSIPILTATTVSANAIQTTGNITAGNIKVNALANITGTLRASNTVNFTGASNVTLGSVTNLHISGGINGYVLTTDGLGNLSWEAGGGGGNGTPGGSNTQVQYNDNGSFGGDPFFTYDNFNKVVQIGGNLVANSLQLGAGVYKWSTSQVYFATTASTTPAQVLYSIPVANLSGVDFEIFGTEPAGPSRQSCKISALYYDGTIAFNEYASLFVNGGVGNFEVDYDAGNIITPASMKLKVTPNTINPVTYKMLITVYAG